MEPIDKVIQGLGAAAEYITEVADHDFGERHEAMCESIDKAISILRYLHTLLNYPPDTLDTPA